jgi:uncharacterized protein (TIGR04255 family)
MSKIGQSLDWLDPSMIAAHNVAESRPGLRGDAGSDSGETMGLADNETIYPNQPLSNVACEARFPGELQIECERFKFWDRIRDQYPQIEVPMATEGEALALRGYRFLTSEPDRSVTVALHSISYSEAKYRGHTLFIKEFLRLAGIFHELFPRVQKLTRLGWRYINVMPFSREDGTVPLGRILKFGINVPFGMFGATTALDLQWSGHHHQNGDVQIRLAVVKREEEPTQEALLLDIDFSMQNSEALVWANLPSLAQDARRSAREVFEEMITDEYREYLKGNTL